MSGRRAKALRRIAAGLSAKRSGGTLTKRERAFLRSTLDAAERNAGSPHFPRKGEQPDRKTRA